MVEPRIVSFFVWLSVFRVRSVGGFCVFVVPFCKLRVCPIRICAPQSAILDSTERAPAYCTICWIVCRASNGSPDFKKQISFSLCTELINCTYNPTRLFGTICSHRSSIWRVEKQNTSKSAWRRAAHIPTQLLAHSRRILALKRSAPAAAIPLTVLHTFPTTPARTLLRTKPYSGSDG